MYECIREWRDLTDGHIYHVGDAFPYDGREIPESRIAELTSKQNKAGFAMIKAVPAPVEEIPVESPKQPRKAVKSRKKAE